MARVIISAGHTQNEPGAVTQDLKEVDLTRKISTKVTARLRDEGIITLSVPPELDLPTRIEWINKTGYKEETEDICIEFHINDGGKSGIEGWYKGEGESKSQKLTKHIVEEACKVTKLTNQGVKGEFDHSLKSLAFLSNTNPTGALIECLYIDSPDDKKFLKDDSKLDLLASGIVSGIKKFFGIEDINKSVTPNIQKQTIPGATTSFPRPSTLGSTGAGYTMPPPMPRGTPSYSPPSPYGGVGGFGAPKPVTTPKSREDMKKMVSTKYQQILGRKVNDQDLNYFANLGLSEDQMLKRLVESQDHITLVGNAQEYKKIKPKYDELVMKSERLEVQVADKEKIIKQQNDLISQKNKSIQELQGSSLPVSANVQSHSSPESPTEPSEISTIGYQEVQPPKETFFDRILKKLNDIFD
jgi:hypothetical protein